jgi:hypothetical protein
MASNATKTRSTYATRKLGKALNVDPAEAARIAGEFCNRPTVDKSDTDRAKALLADLRIMCDGDDGEGAELAITYALKFGSAVRRVVTRFAEVRVEDRDDNELLDAIDKVECAEVPARLCSTNEAARALNKVLAEVYEAARKAELCDAQGRDTKTLGF